MKKKFYMVRDRDGTLCLYPTKPVKLEDEWTYDGLGDFGVLPDDIFPNIKWEDEEPTEVEIVITSF